MNQQLRAIAELDRVIHEPGRMMIVALLAAVKECDFLYLQRETELNKGNLSSHLARLEECGYVEIRKTYRGKVPQTLLRLTSAGRAAFDAYCKQLNLALVEHLQALSAGVQAPVGAQPKWANS
ncbi:MAG TPA: transcriptional regulator [Candidatus Acidoferrales bacterium]|nr:transcriptional regulator [Candidatus Acidoferrales bacterium]